MHRPLRLACYNILEGLRPVSRASAERRQIDRERAEAALRTVRELEADILVVNEALFCREHAGTFVDYGALFGFRFQAAALYDGGWGNAILSLHPILKSEEVHFDQRSGLITVIATPGGDLTVASYHPHPRREPEAKARDFVRLVAGLSGPLIVAGDFNAISPEDAIDRPEMARAFAGFSRTPKADLDRFIASGKLIFAALAEAGLHDAIPPAGRRYTIPTDLISRDKRSGMRIDHILANSGVEVVSGSAVHTPASDVASDHHPVLVEFRLR